MNLPHGLPLCSPPLAVWTGETGKRYDFAVLRTGTAWIDAPAVYVLARHEDSRQMPLFVGETSSLQLHFGAHRHHCVEEWRAAMAGGMTHVHVRFEAMSAAARTQEAADLIASLRPPLNATPDAVPDAMPDAMPNAMPDAVPDAVHALDDREAAGVEPADHPTVRVPCRGHRLSPWRPGGEAGEFVTPQWLEEPRRPAWQLRVDPACEAEPGFDSSGASLASGPVVEPEVVEPEVVEPEVVEPGIEPAVQSPHAALVEPSPAVIAGPPTVPVASMAAPAAPIASAASAPSAEATPAEAATSGAMLAEQAPRRRPGLLTRLLGMVVGRAAAGAAADAAMRREPQPDVAAATPPAPPDAAVPTAPAAAAQAEAAPATAVAAAQAEAAQAEAAPATAVAAAQAEAAPAAAVAAEPAAEPAATEHEAVVAVPTRPAASEVPAASEAPAVSEPAAASEPAPAAPKLPVAAAVRTEAAGERTAAAKRALRLDPQAPVVLFAGDMGCNDGADILFEAILIVCAGHASVQFVYAGEGPLLSQLQERAGRAELGERCRFLGDVSAERFPPVLAAADFVAIPARVPQGEELARQALAAGKPVLVTHQSGIRCVVHGENGLVTYDNPGSFVWGVRELLGPLYGTLLQHLNIAVDEPLDRAA